MLTEQINPPPTSNEQAYFQSQPQFSLQPQPQSIVQVNTFQYTQSTQLRPIPTQVQQSIQITQNQYQGQFANSSSINRSGFASIRGSKYNNKYSFKRHGTVNRSKLMSTSVNQIEGSCMRASHDSLMIEVNYWRSMAQQQENALVRIREFAFNRRRGIVESSSTLGLESIRHANSLSEVYNLSLIEGNIQPLEFIAETQQIIQNGGNVSTITTTRQQLTRQQEVVVNYELANQRSNSQLVNNNINISKNSININNNNNNRPVVYIQQASQSVRQPSVDQNIQQFRFQENTSFVPAPASVPVPVPAPAAFASSTTVNGQRTNITNQFVQVSQVSQTIRQPIREPIKESSRPQSITINPEASKPQISKNDFSIPSYTPYEASYKPSNIPTYTSNETTSYTPYEASYKQYEAPTYTSHETAAYKPYQVPAYTSQETTTYTQKPESFFFTREEHYTLPNPNTNSNNNNAININSNDLYTLEIRELRNKVQTLEQQKSSLIDKIRTIERTNFSNSNSQQTIQIYRDEINQLKIQIAELTDLYNSGSGRQHNDTQLSQQRKSILILTQTNKQYEEQLIQAQNHIIYLENSRNTDENTLHLEDEIKHLRQTIAKYTQHLEQLDIERQKYLELLQQRESEIQSYLQEVNESRSYIESLEAHIQKTKHAVEGNGVSYDNYNQLIAEYGKKQLQVIILMEEINRLNYRYNELQAHLEKAEEYIIHIQETNNTGNVGGVTTKEVAQLRSQYEAELARAAEENNTLNQTIHRLQITIDHNSIIERTSKVSSSQSSINNDDYNRLLQELNKRDQEIRLLSQETLVLNRNYADVKDHLEKAEDYIIHLQEAQQGNSPVNALVAPDTDRLRLEEELHQLQVKLRQSQTELLNEKRERETLQHRSDLFSAEYEDMESRYKNALESLNKRYDQLLQERNSITARLSQAQDRLVTEASTANREDISHLNSSMQTLDSQLKETREHLKRAQEYIEVNVRVWQEASGYKERHDQQLAFIQLLHQDLDNTKRQNQELAGKLEHFDHLVGEIQRLRSDNEKLIIVVHSKENAGNSTSLKQIDQIQESLTNYTRLYQESQTRVATLRIQIVNLNHQLQAKQAQLDQTSHQSLQIEDHLRKAEEHIVYMQQQLTTSQINVQQLYAALRAATSKSNELHEVLRHTQEHIYNVEKQFNRK